MKSSATRRPTGLCKAPVHPEIAQYLSSVFPCISRCRNSKRFKTQAANKIKQLTATDWSLTPNESQANALDSSTSRQQSTSILSSSSSSSKSEGRNGKNSLLQHLCKTVVAKTACEELRLNYSCIYLSIYLSIHLSII